MAGLASESEFIRLMVLPEIGGRIHFGVELVVSVAQPSLEAVSGTESHAHLPGVTPDRGVGEVLIVHHGHCSQNEGCEHHWTGNQIVAKADSKVLQAAVKISIIDR
jgi:hypothetical protein